MLTWAVLSLHPVCTLLSSFLLLKMTMSLLESLEVVILAHPFAKIVQ